MNKVSVGKKRKGVIPMPEEWEGKEVEYWKKEMIAKGIERWR